MKGPDHGKERRTARRRDLTTAPDLIPALADDAPVPGLTPLVEGRVPGGGCLHVEGVPPDVAPPAPDIDIGALLCAGGALALLHHLAAALQALAHLKKQ